MIMKHLSKTMRIVFPLLCVVFVLMSCDANKSKVKDVASQFAKAVQTKDNVVIYDLYPDIRTYSSTILADTIDDSGISVEYRKEDSTYLAKFNDQQSLVLKVKGDSITIVDSYNIMKLDSAAYELAAKTGAPVKKLSDVENAKLFDDNSDFIGYLSMLSNAANGNLSYTNGRYSWRGGYYPTVSFDWPVTNNGESEVKGMDYTVKIAYFNRKTSEQVGTSVVDGVDLAPGQSYVFTTFKNELFNLAKKSNIYATLEFAFKNKTKSRMLVDYGSFSGKEYTDYLQWQKEQPIDDIIDEGAEFEGD